MPFVRRHLLVLGLFALALVTGGLTIDSDAGYPLLACVIELQSSPDDSDCNSTNDDEECCEHPTHSALTLALQERSSLILTSAASIRLTNEACPDGLCVDIDHPPQLS